MMRKLEVAIVLIIALLVTACAGKEGISQAPSDSVSIYETSSSVAATEKESLSSAPTLTPPDNIYYINENISTKIGDRLEELYKGDKVTTYEYETYEYMAAFSKPVQTKELSRIMNENEIIDIIWNVGILNTDNHISRIAINGKEMTYLYEKEEIKSAMGYVWKLRGFTYEGREYTFENDESGYITAISDDNGECIARYVYREPRNKDISIKLIDKVLSYNGTEWVVNTDRDFIGNLNRIVGYNDFYDSYNNMLKVGGWLDLDTDTYLRYKKGGNEYSVS